MAIKYDDITDESLGLNLISIYMGDPEPRFQKTEIPGKNGVLDQSEALTGHMTYAEREFEILYTLIADSEQEYLQKMSTVRNALHGKRRKLVISADPDFYYDATPVVEESPEASFFGEITITGTAYPYKRKLQETVVSRDLTGAEAQIICKNLAEPVVPTFETSASMKIIFGKKSFNIQNGQHILDLVFGPGDNVLKVTGTGNIKIKYREGSL